MAVLKNQMKLSPLGCFSEFEMFNSVEIWVAMGPNKKLEL